MFLRTIEVSAKSARKLSLNPRMMFRTHSVNFKLKFLLFFLSAASLRQLRAVFQVDMLPHCPLAVSRHDSDARRSYKIFIGAGTRNYLVMAKHLVSSLEERSTRLVNHSSGVYILTSEQALGDCMRTFRSMHAKCVRSTPQFQQRGSHRDVYNKFDATSHSETEDWIVYLDADMVVLEELFSVLVSIPSSYLVIGVKNFPLMKRFMFGEEAWGVNGGFLVYNKRIVDEQRHAIQQMMQKGINDQIIWSWLFYQYRRRRGSCLLDETYNCRLNTHRLCHKRAKVAHYSSTAKRALYYFQKSN